MRKQIVLTAAVMLCALPALASRLHSSIQVPFVKGTPDAQEECNTPRLFKMARISKEQAKTVAKKRFKGHFGKIDLENEDGNLIWSVEVGKRELAIDAGNGKILVVE